MSIRNEVFLKKLILPYNKKFALENPYALKYAETYKVDRLVEMTLAKLGGHKVLDEYNSHADLSDGSEVKCVSIKPCNLIQIKNVRTVAGSLKSGAIRLVVFNRVDRDLNYFFLPRKVWRSMPINNNTNGQGFITFSYSKDYDSFGQLDAYEVDGPRELARALNC